jgi:hypothetical protein
MEHFPYNVENFDSYKKQRGGTGDYSNYFEGGFGNVIENVKQEFRDLSGMPHQANKEMPSFNPEFEENQRLYREQERRFAEQKQKFLEEEQKFLETQKRFNVYPTFPTQGNSNQSIQSNVTNSQPERIENIDRGISALIKTNQRIDLNSTIDQKFTNETIQNKVGTPINSLPQQNVETKIEPTKVGTQIDLNTLTKESNNINISTQTKDLTPNVSTQIQNPEPNIETKVEQNVYGNEKIGTQIETSTGIENLNLRENTLSVKSKIDNIETSISSHFSTRKPFSNYIPLPSYRKKKVHCSFYSTLDNFSKGPLTFEDDFRNEKVAFLRVKFPEISPSKIEEYLPNVVIIVKSGRIIGDFQNSHVPLHAKCNVFKDTMNLKPHKKYKKHNEAFGTSDEDWKQFNMDKRIPYLYSISSKACLTNVAPYEVTNQDGVGKSPMMAIGEKCVLHKMLHEGDMFFAKDSCDNYLKGLNPNTKAIEMSKESFDNVMRTALHHKTQFPFYNKIVVTLFPCKNLKREIEHSNKGFNYCEEEEEKEEFLNKVLTTPFKAEIDLEVEHSFYFMQ